MDSQLALYYAVCIQDEKEVLRLLNEGYDPNLYRSIDFLIPLHKAVEHRNTQITKYLLSSGANANESDILGFGTLHIISMFSGIVDMIDLPETREDANLINCYYYGPLGKDYERNTLEIANMLLISKANINMTTTFGSTPLHIASKSNNEFMVKFLLEKGADINIMDSIENTPLFYAACTNNMAISKMLLDYGAKIDVFNKDNCSPLHYATSTKNTAVVELFLKNGANVNSLDRYYRSSLHKAIGIKSMPIIKLLLRYGADCNIKDNHGCSSLHYAMRIMDRGLTDMLLLHGANPDITNNIHHSPLYNALLYPYAKNIESLIEGGADINITDNVGSTPLSNLQENTVDDENALVFISYFVLQQQYGSQFSESTGFSKNNTLINEVKKYLEIKHTCEYEIRKLKKIKFYSGHTADIFLYCKNVNLLSKFVYHPEVKSLPCKFPIYARQLKKLISLGINRRNLLESALRVINSVPRNLYTRYVSIETLPVIVKYMILEMLTNDDLRSIIKITVLNSYDTHALKVIK